MMFRIFLFGLALFSLLTTHAQPLKSAGTDYIDFVLDGNKIWLLSRAGTLKSVDPDSGEVRLQSMPDDSGVVVLTKDHLGNIIAGTAKQISKFDQQHHRWSRLAVYRGKLTGIVFDSKNRLLAITNQGIVDTQMNRIYFPDSTMYLNDQIRNREQWFGTPTYLMDKQDRIWVGFGYGEWGGDLFVFDVMSGQYMRPQLNSYQINLNPVQAFIQGNKNVFMTTGMAHFTTHGSLVAFTDLSANVVLKSESQWKSVSATRKVMEGGEYIGPATYNNQNHCVYFYSQHGIFKGDPDEDDLSTMSKWTLVIKPQLQWTNGQRNAIGPAMNVLKMQVTSAGILFFLTKHDGLGVYNGKALRFIK